MDANLDVELLKKIAYVSISEKRIKVVKTLRGSIKFPKDIADDIGVTQKDFSKTLRELKEAGIIECINEEVRKGRLYRLTGDGNKIIDELE